MAKTPIAGQGASTATALFGIAVIGRHSDMERLKGHIVHPANLLALAIAIAGIAYLAFLWVNGPEVYSSGVLEFPPPPVSERTSKQETLHAAAGGSPARYSAYAGHAASAEGSPDAGGLQVMLATLGPGLAGQRDRALLLIGFVGAFRRSELVGLDVEITSAGLRLRLQPGKADAGGPGRWQERS